MSPSGDHVVYLQDVLGGVQVRSADLDSGAAAQVGGVTPPGRNAGPAVIDPTGTRVVYRAEIDAVGQYELFSAPISGGPGVQLNPPLPATAHVACCTLISPDGDRVVYRIVHTGANTSLHSVRLDGSGHVDLAGMQPDDLVGVVKVSPNSSRVVFTADLNADEAEHLYSIPIAGGPLITLDNANGFDTRVIENYQITSDSASVAYGVQLDSAAEIVIEAGAIDDNDSERISEGGGDAMLMEITADDGSVLYAIGETGAASNQLHRVAIDGGDTDVLELPVDGPSEVTSVRALDNGVLVITADVLAAGGSRIFLAGVTPSGAGGESPGSVFVGVPPSRLFDSRPGEPGPGPKGLIAAGGDVDVQIGGVGGVPFTASAVVLNVTVTETQAAGFFTVHPAGTPRPLASSLNATAAGQDRPNLVVAPIGADGRVTIYSQSGAHVVADVMGYFAPVVGPVTAGRILPLDPFRAFDTRVGETAPGPKGRLGSGDSIDVQIGGVGGVPADAAAVVINITGTEAAARGFVSVWPTGSAMPVVSTLNLMSAGETTPNLAIVPLGDVGRLSLFSQSGAHLLGDVTGYVTNGSAAADTSGVFVAVDPARLFDTRPGQPGGGPKGFVGAGGQIVTQIGGVTGVPADVGLALFNLTGDQGATGFVTSYPTNVARPIASSLNLNGPNDIRANAVATPTGPSGAVVHYSQSGAHLVADIAGYTLP